MKKINKSRLGTVVAGAAVLAVFGGGTAVAGSLITSAQIANGTIVGLDVKNSGLTGSDIKGSSLTGSDVKGNSLTGYDIKNGTLSNADINVFTASVNQDGTLVNSSGGVSVEKLPGTGNYSVDFGHNVKECAFLATAGGVQVGIDHGQVNVADKSGNANAVFVETSDAAGADKNLDFHLAVIC